MSSPSAKTAAPRHRSTEIIRSALVAIYRAYELLGLYPTGHAALTSAANDGVEAINNATRVRSPLTIVISKDGIQCDDVSVQIDPSLQPLVHLLDQCDLAALDLVGPLNAAQFMKFAETLREGVREKLHGGQLAEKLQRATNSQAWFRPFNFSNLAAAAATDLSTSRRRKAGDSDASDQQWSSRLRSLVMQDTFDPGEALMTIGEDGSAEGGADTLRISHIAGVLRETPEQQRPVVADRLRTMLDSLGERFRSSLFDAEALSDPNAARDVADASSVLPPDELLQALEVSARQGARPTNATVMLFNKLLNLFEGDPTRVQRLAGIYTQLDDITAARADSGSAADTLSELLSTRSDANYNPDDYSSTLARITKVQALDEGDSRLDLTWANPTIHAAEIASELIAAGIGRNDAGPWQFIVRSIDTMIDQRRIDVFSRLLCIAADVRDQVDESVCETIDQLQQCLAAPEVVEKFIQSLDEHALQSHETRRMFQQLGAPAIATLLRSFDAMPAECRGPFIVVMYQNSRETFRAACKQLAGQQHKVLQQLAGNAGEFQEDVRLAFLHPLLEHEDANVRRDAFELLDQSIADWPKDALLRGTIDADTEIQRRSMARLLRQPDDRSIRELGKLMAEHGRRLNDFLFGVAASVLEQVGDTGRERLAGAFRTLLRKPTPKRVKRAMQLIPILKRNRSVPHVRSALSAANLAMVAALRIAYRIPKGSSDA